MRSFAKAFVYRLTSAVPLSLLQRLGGNESVFPYHHVVSDAVLPHVKPLYSYKGTREFISDLESLLLHYKPIAPADLLAHIGQHSALPQRRFLISFDDGFREVHDVVAPLLKAKGVPAVFFVNPSFIDNKTMFYRSKLALLLWAAGRTKDAVKLRQLHSLLGLSAATDHALRAAMLQIKKADDPSIEQMAQLLEVDFSGYLKEQQPWLTTTQLAQLSKDGFVIGAHSLDHPVYQQLSMEEQLRQTGESCNYISSFNPQECLFSFPHSDAGVTQQFFDALAVNANRPQLLFGVQNGRKELNNYMIHRFNAERPGVPVHNSIKLIHAYHFLHRLLGRGAIKRTYA